MRERDAVPTGKEPSGEVRGNPMMRCEHEEELLDLLYGEVEGERAEDLRRHVASCAPCSRVWDDLRLARSLARELPLEEAPEAPLQVALRAAEAMVGGGSTAPVGESSPPRRSWWERLERWLRPAAVTVAGLFVLAVGLVYVLEDRAGEAPAGEVFVESEPSAASAPLAAPAPTAPPEEAPSAETAPEPFAAFGGVEERAASPSGGVPSKTRSQGVERPEGAVASTSAARGRAARRVRRRAARTADRLASSRARLTQRPVEAPASGATTLLPAQAGRGGGGFASQGIGTLGTAEAEASAADTVVAAAPAAAPSAGPARRAAMRRRVLADESAGDLSAARARRRAGDCRQAVVRYRRWRRAHADHPDWGRVALEEADCLLRLGRATEAEQLARRVAARVPALAERSGRIVERAEAFRRSRRSARSKQGEAPAAEAERDDSR